MSRAHDLHPTDSAERVAAVDIIRGIALFGVLIVNILTIFRVPLLEHILKTYDDSRGADRVVDQVVAFALEFKAFTIFSFLFGVGIAIQSERAAERKVSARSFLLRRLAFLLVLGAAHLFLIWNGDILTLYAICGLFLLALVGLPAPALVVIGGAFILLPEFVSFGLSQHSGRIAMADIAQARYVYGHEGFLVILKFRWYETWSLIVPLLIAVLPRTTGLMCWGAAAWRSGVLRAPARHRRKLALAVVIGLIAGGAITVNEICARSSGHAVWPALRHTHVDASILLAMAWVAGLLLWLTPPRASYLPGLAALGQMALTNYLVQSMVLGFLFYGYGFGLFGRIGSAAAAGIGVALYIGQVYASCYWMGRFRFGPFEWLWRTLTYGRRQTMGRRRVNDAVSISAGR